MKVFQKWFDRPKGMNTQMDVTTLKGFLTGLHVNKTTVRLQTDFILPLLADFMFKTLTGICVLRTVQYFFS
jgi:hypothetical protein